MYNIVKLKLIERKNWAGVTRFKKCFDSISPLLDISGTVKTGLTPEDEEQLGKALGQDLRKSSPFWVEYRIVMSDAEREFDLTNPEHQLAYKFLLANKRVANSLEELHEWPYADYVLYSEKNAAAKQNREYKSESKAWAILSKMSNSEIRDTLKLYPSMGRITEDTDPEIIEAKLTERMKEDPDFFIAICEDSKKDTKVFVKQLVDARIFRKNKSAYFYGDDLIGHDLEMTVSYLDDPQNSPLKATLKEALINPKR